MEKFFNLGVSASDEFSKIRYSYFTWQHIIIICLSIAILIAAAIIFHKKKNLLETVLKISAVLVTLTLTGLIIYSSVTHEYNLEWYLPFHICNLFFILLPLAVFFKKGFRTFFADYFVIGGIFGCVLNIIFPLSSMLYYPVFHIASLLVWLHHIIIGVFGVYLITSGNYTEFNAIKLLSVLSVLLFFALIVNYFTKANFLFINFDRAVTPVTQINKALAPLGVWAVVIMIYGIAIIMHLILNVFLKKKNKQ